MSLKNLSADVYEQLDAKLDAAVEPKQIKSWLMTLGVAATVAEIRDYDAGREQVVSPVETEKPEGDGRHQAVSEPEPEAPRSRLASPSSYISQPGLQPKEAQARLLERMLQLTDRAWDDYDATGSLKIAEFLQRQVPATVRLLADVAPVVQEENLESASLFEGFRQDVPAYEPVDTETALKTIYQDQETDQEPDHD